MWLAQVVQPLSGLQPASQFPWVSKDVPQTTGSSLQSIAPHSCLAITPCYFLTFYNKQQGGMLETRRSPRPPSDSALQLCHHQSPNATCAPFKKFPASTACSFVQSLALFSPLQDGLSSPPTPIALLYEICCTV